MELEDAAARLHGWFEVVSRATEQSMLQAAPEGPHREAIVLDLLKRNGRRLVEARLDRKGELYQPLCVFLAAAVHRLDVTLTTDHWRAALANLRNLRIRILTMRAEAESVGLDLGSPAQTFKEAMDESIVSSGFGGKPTFLDERNRAVALGLAVNWQLRLIPAYAIECKGLPQSPGRQDLAWIAGIAVQLVGTSAAA